MSIRDDEPLAGMEAPLSAIRMERIAQITKHQNAPTNDDVFNGDGQLVKGAIAFAWAALREDVWAGKAWSWRGFWPRRDDELVGKRDYRALLVKAAALLVAEIERFDRAKKKERL